MQPFNCVMGILAKLAGLGTALRGQSEFTCSDCERVDQCGLPPHDNCIYKIAKIERGWQRADWLTRLPVM